MVPYRTISETELPKDLRPLPLLNVGGNSGNNTYGNGNGNNNRNNNNNNRNNNGNNGRGNPNANATPNGNQNLQQRQRLNNSQHHPLFQAFWNAVPVPRRNDSLGRWLRLANSSTNQCLATLRLASNDCGHFHLRGYCTRPNCGNSHQPKDLTQQSVEEVVGLLRQGLQQAT